MDRTRAELNLFDHFGINSFYDTQSLVLTLKVVVISLLENIYVAQTASKGVIEKDSLID